MQILTTKIFYISPTYHVNIWRMFRGLVLILIVNIHVYAQSAPSREATLKAVFLFNFTQFVEWPLNTFNDTEAPFIIGILGNDPFGHDIDEMIEGEKVKGHPLIAKRFKDVKDVKDCQILYISSNDPDHVKELLVSLPNRNMLTVSDTYNFARAGGMIRIYTQNNKIKLQINTSAAKAANLNISSKLLRIANIVD